MNLTKMMTMNTLCRNDAGERLVTRVNGIEMESNRIESNWVQRFTSGSSEMNTKRSSRDESN